MSLTIHLSDDLIFASKVTATGRALNLSLVTARQIPPLIEALSSKNPRLLILDLHHPGLNLTDIMIWRKLAKSPWVGIGYGSHVDVERLKAARRAGLEFVMPRSQFVRDLEAHWPDWLLHNTRQDHGHSIHQDARAGE